MTDYRVVTTEAGEYVWTVAQQTADAGSQQTTSWIEIFQYDAVSDTNGPAVRYFGESEIVQEGNAATGLAAQRSTFGDILLSFIPNNPEPERQYDIEIFVAGILTRTYVRHGSDTASGRITLPYPVSDSVPDLLSQYPDTFEAPAYIEWRVVTRGVITPVWKIYSDMYANTAPLNNSFVQRVVAFLGSDLMVDMFTAASGTTYATTGAATLRNALAAALSLPAHTVMPVNAAFAGSAMDQGATTAGNGWYNAAANTNGARIASASAVLSGLGVPVQYGVWNCGLADAIALEADGSQIPGTSTTGVRWQTSVRMTLLAMRAAFPAMAQFWTPTQRFYYQEPALERYAQSTYALNPGAYNQLNAQATSTEIWTNAPMVPAASRIDGYAVTDSPFPVSRWRLSRASYQAWASLLASAMVSPGRVSAANLPAWRISLAMAGFSKTKNPSTGDIAVTWTPPSVSGVTVAGYTLYNRKITDASVFETVDVTPAAWNFLYETQVAMYGFGTDFVNMVVWPRFSDGTHGRQTVYSA